MDFDEIWNWGCTRSVAGQVSIW